jgi:hypothetical protein
MSVQVRGVIADIEREKPHCCWLSGCVVSQSDDHPSFRMSTAAGRGSSGNRRWQQDQ